MHENLTRDSEVQSSTDRAFGFVFTGLFLVIGLAPLIFGRPMRIWSLVVAAIFVVIAAFMPALLAPLKRVWTKFGLLLHEIVSPVVLGVAFYLVITPMGLVMRLFGKDLLRLRFDRASPTYWIKRTPPGPQPESLIDQF